METPMFDGNDKMAVAWQRYFSTLGDKLSTAFGSITESTLTTVTIGSDAVDVTTPVAVTGTDSVDLTALNVTLATLATEINAIVTVLNALNDKLVQTNLMTEL